jgi:hypothetical protein
MLEFFNLQFTKKCFTYRVGQFDHAAWGQKSFRVVGYNNIIGYSHWNSMAVVLWFILSIVIIKK